MSSSDRAAEPLAVRYGDYEVLRELERGPDGVIFAARQVSLDRPVLLLVVDAQCLPTPEAVEQFRQEAAAVARLDHPGILRVLEVGEQDGQHFVAVAWFAGVPLAERLAAGPLDDRAAAVVVRHLTEAVYYANGKGVMDGALSPARVLLGHDGTPRLRLFGLRTLGPDSAGWLAPERVGLGRNEVRKPTDVYGLGTILYACLTGRPPFQAASRKVTERQVRERDPLPPSRLNPRVHRDLEAVCLRCLEKRPGDRYRTAAKLMGDLLAWLARRPVQARPRGRLRRALGWCGRNRQAVVLALIALVVGGGPEIWHWWRARQVNRAAWVKVTSPDGTPGQYRSAVRFYERRQRADPHDAEFQVGLGIALYRVGSYAEAAQALSAAIRPGDARPAPGGPHDRFRRLALLKTGNVMEALQDWSPVLVDNPEIQEAFFDVAALIAWTEDPEPSIRSTAAALLGEVGRRRGAAAVAAAIRPLAERLTGPAGAEAWRTLEPLPLDEGWLASGEGRRTLQSLAQLPAGPGGGRGLAIRFLGKVGPAASPALTTLVEELVAPQEYQTRALAREALGRIDPAWPQTPAARQAIPTLALHLTSGDADRREAAAWALEHIDKGWEKSPEARRTIPKLVLRLAAPDDFAAGQARDLLAAIDPKWTQGAEARQVVPVLVERLTAPEGDARRAAAVLGLLGPTARAAVPALVEASAGLGPHPECARAATAALQRIDPDWRRSATARRIAVDLAGRLADPKAQNPWKLYGTLVALGPGSQAAIGQLQKVLSSEERVVRPRALAGLARIDTDWYKGEPGLRAYQDLLRLLEDTDPDVRRAAVEGLDRLPRHRDLQAAIAALVVALSESNLADPAGKLLERLDKDWTQSQSGRKAIPVLIRRLAAPQPKVREAAARILGQFGTNATDAVPALLDRLTDGGMTAPAFPAWQRTGVASEALAALDAIDPDWAQSAEARKRIPDLVAGLATFGAHDTVEQALKRIEPDWLESKAGRQGIPLLIRRLDDKTAHVAVAAARELGRFGPAAAAAVPSLTEWLAAEQDSQAHAAAQTLAKIGSAAAPAVPALARRLGAGDVGTRRAIIGALAAIGPAAVEAVPALIPELTESATTEDYRSAVAEALDRMEKDWMRSDRARQAIPGLLERLADPMPAARNRAASLLDRLDPDWGKSAAARRVVPRLIARLDASTALDVRVGAAAALGQIGAPAATAVPALIQRLADADAGSGPAGKEAAEALNRIRPAWRDAEEVKQLVPDLADRLTSKNEAERHAAAWALDAIGPAAAPARSALVAALGDSTWAVRHLAARAIGTIGPRAEDVRVLIEHLADPWTNDDPYDNHRDVIGRLLDRADSNWRKSEAAQQAVSAFIKRLQQPTRDARRGAIRGLGRLGPLAAPALDPLLSLMTDPSAEMRKDAQMALTQINPKWPYLPRTEQFRQLWAAEVMDRHSTVRGQAQDALRLHEAARAAAPRD
jgi:HEAT repeat protein